MPIPVTNFKIRNYLEELSNFVNREMRVNQSETRDEIEKLYHLSGKRIVISDERLPHLGNSTSRCTLSLYKQATGFAPVLEVFTPCGTRRHYHPDLIAANLTPNMRKLIQKYEKPSSLVYNHLGIPRDVFEYSEYPTCTENWLAVEKSISRHNRKLDKKNKGILVLH